MAKHFVQIGSGLVALALGLMLIISLGPLLAHVGQTPLTPGDWATLRFTLNQALVSAALSCLAGIFLARALHRRRFWGRGALIRLISAPFLLPSIAAVIGLVVIFGRNGWVNAGLSALGLPTISIFGFGGVVLGHVFLNLPLATRMVLQSWYDIPSERFRLAQTIGFGPRAIFVHLELPMLRTILTSAFMAIFLICLSSFAVALILGGGPRASTLELGIYQSLRFEFDLARAANLAMLQMAVGLAAVLLMAVVWKPIEFGAGVDRPLGVVPSSRRSFALDCAVIVVAAGFFLLPILAIFGMGLGQFWQPPLGFWGAAARSVGIAVAAALIATVAATLLAWARAKGAGLWVEVVAMAPLCTSALALGTGMFMALRPIIAPQGIAIPLAIGFGAAMSLPFLFRLLLPSCRAVAKDYGKLSAQLGLSPVNEMRLVLLPRISRGIGFSMGLCAAMAMGDFGVIALFGAVDQATLPILVARLLGSYQMAAAAAVTLWLVVFSFGLFWLFDAWGAGRATD